jgi:hypothetical protein
MFPVAIRPSTEPDGWRLRRLLMVAPCWPGMRTHIAGSRTRLATPKPCEHHNGNTDQRHVDVKELSQTTARRRPPRGRYSSAHGSPPSCAPCHPRGHPLASSSLTWWKSYALRSRLAVAMDKALRGTARRGGRCGAGRHPRQPGARDRPAGWRRRAPGRVRLGVRVCRGIQT